MGTQDALRNKVEELGERQWDDSAITARYEKFAKDGIPRKSLNKEECLANKPQILERVQQRAEEYNYILKNCAQGTALALMEEFGLQDYVIGIEEIQAHSVVDGEERILADRDQLAATIQREVPRLRELAQKNGRIIAHLAPNTVSRLI